MHFNDALPRLVALYEKGELVPFLGAGMSVPACRRWLEFVQALEEQVGIPAHTMADDYQILMQRANRAIRALRRRDPDGVRDAVRAAIVHSEVEVPPQTEALAQIWWPLVLTSNYDDWYQTLRQQHHHPSEAPLSVLGRSPADCQRVLASLTGPADPILWALQGYLGSDTDSHLARELVVGHDEYRRATHREADFRKTFAQVYRTRSLLFLGSSLRESYFLDLFGEILEFYGPNPHYHYALVPRGEVDPDFLYSSLNIIALEYGDYQELPHLLNQLHEALHRDRPRASGWRYAIQSPAAWFEPGGWDLEIVRGGLPLPGDGECIMLSAGGSVSYPAVSRSIWRYLERARANAMLQNPHCHQTLSPYCGRLDGSPFFYAVARNEGDRRDLRTIARATKDMLETVATQTEFGHVRAQLLSGGGRTFYPRWFLLTEMIRSFANWRRNGGDPGLKMTIHIVDRNVLFDVATGRIDVLDLLSCEQFRFWVEVVLRNGDIQRQLSECSDETPILEIAASFDLPASGWNAEVFPVPTPGAGPIPLEHMCAETDLAQLGVVPGGTLRFVQR